MTITSLRLYKNGCLQILLAELVWNGYYILISDSNTHMITDVDCNLNAVMASHTKATWTHTLT